MRWVGEKHNALLKDIYKALKAEKLIAGKLTRERLVSVASRACHDFMREHAFPAAYCAPVDELRSAGRAPQRSDAVATAATLASSTLQSYLASIESATGYMSTVGEYHNHVAQIESSAAATLTGQDLELLYAVTSVAVGSAYYWDAEVETWYDLVNPGCTQNCQHSVTVGAAGSRQQPLEPAGLTWWGRAGWRILGADVGGAIGGAFAGIVTGVGAAPAAFGAAAGSSASRAILELMDVLI
jgi:hypothetical protein